MQTFCDWLCGARVHFVGVGGMGVNALAKYALDMGAVVSGSDRKYNALCDALAKLGARVYEGEDAKAVQGVDALVYSSAIRKDHPELVAARNSGALMFERQEFLREVEKNFDFSVAVSGTHGKSSTTAMLTHILAHAHKSFVSMIGAEAFDFSNYVNNTHHQGGSIFVSEACEYRRNFLALSPSLAVVTNAECDHPDSYKNLGEVYEAFGQFVHKAQRCVLPTRLIRLAWFEGVQDGAADMFVTKLPSLKYSLIDKASGICRHFEGVIRTSKDGVRLFEGGRFIGEFCVSEQGEYNLENAMLAIIAASACGVDLQLACQAVASYKGVKRRFERVGKIAGKEVIFDFAHHPHEIECVLRRGAKLGKLLVVFQPHTYTRTKAYFDDFVSVLTDEQNGIGTLIIASTYAARESAIDGGRSLDLYDAIFDKSCKKDVYLSQSTLSTVDLVQTKAKQHDAVLIVGAGDIDEIRHLLRFDDVD